MGLDTVDLVMKIEKEFKIEVPVQRWEQLVTVEDVYDIVWDFAQNSIIDKNEMIAGIDKILVHHIGCGPDEIAPAKSLTSDLGLD